MTLFTAVNGTFESVDNRFKLGPLSTRNNYNTAMARTTFGYQPVGWGLGPWKEQADTERPMPQEMKTYLDEMVLEGKIPDEFDKVELFQQILQEIEEK